MTGETQYNTNMYNTILLIVFENSDFSFRKYIETQYNTNMYNTILLIVFENSDFSFRKYIHFFLSRNIHTILSFSKN